MADVLIYSDKLNLALELITAAKTINPEVTAVAINDEELAQALAGAGAKVWQVDNDAINLADTAALAQAIAQLADKAGANTVLLASNRRGRELAGRVAQKLKAGCLTNVCAMLWVGLLLLLKQLLQTSKLLLCHLRVLPLQVMAQAVWKM